MMTILLAAAVTMPTMCVLAEPRPALPDTAYAARQAAADDVRKRLKAITECARADVVLQVQQMSPDAAGDTRGVVTVVGAVVVGQSHVQAEWRLVLVAIPRTRTDAPPATFSAQGVFPIIAVSGVTKQVQAWLKANAEALRLARDGQ